MNVQNLSFLELVKAQWLLRSEFIVRYWWVLALLVVYYGVKTYKEVKKDKKTNVKNIFKD